MGGVSREGETAKGKGRRKEKEEAKEGKEGKEKERKKKNRENEKERIIEGRKRESRGVS
mgnify:CR=1 FL=1